MSPLCFMCEKPFKDEDDIIAVVEAKFHLIPSRISYAISKPTAIHELQHRACAEGDLIPPDDEIIEDEDDLN